MLYGIKNRGNICYASAAIQCVCSVLGCIPTDIIELDRIPRVMSDSQEFYEMMSDRIPSLKKRVSTSLNDKSDVPCVPISRIEDIVSFNSYLVIRTSGSSSLSSIKRITIKDKVLDLISMVSFSNSHYIAVVNHDNTWFIHDDERVREVNTDIDIPLYLLFYKNVPTGNV
jgi:hypothetical protein